jgi:hypothetical protein
MDPAVAFFSGAFEIGKAGGRVSGKIVLTAPSPVAAPPAVLFNTQFFL